MARLIKIYSLYHRTFKGGWEKVSERVNDKNFGANLSRTFKGKKVYKIRVKNVLSTRI